MQSIGPSPSPPAGLPWLLCEGARLSRTGQVGEQVMGWGCQFLLEITPGFGPKSTYPASSLLVVIFNLAMLGTRKC